MRRGRLCYYGCMPPALQKAAFRVVKDGLLQAKRRPFASRAATCWLSTGYRRVWKRLPASQAHVVCRLI